MWWFIGSLLVSYAITKQAMRAAERAAAENQGVLINKDSNNAGIPVIYGERRVGGVRVNRATSGTSNKYQYIVLVLGEGEVEDIGNIYIDDKLSTHEDYEGIVTVNKYTGTDTQTADQMMIDAGIGWTVNDRLRGTAYLAVRLKYDQDELTSTPVINAIVKGRKVYDPRTSLTVYSDNPALCLRDYLINDRYGKGLPASAINDTQFGAAADDCEELVEPFSGEPTRERFQCNAVVDVERKIIDNVKDIISGMRAHMPYENGQYGLIIEGAANSNFSFTENHIIGDLSVTSENKSSRYNKVVASFTNKDNEWQEDQVQYPEEGDTTYLDADAGFVSEHRIDLPVTTDRYSAMDIAELILKKSRQSLGAKFTSTSEALNTSVGDIIDITHSTPGWVSKPFRVSNLSLNQDGTVDVEAIEHQDNIYPWVSKDEAPTIPDTVLEDPNFVAAPTNLSVEESTVVANDGTLLPALRISWVGSVDAYVSRYEVQYQRGSAILDHGLISDSYDDNSDHGLITNATSISLDYGSIDTPVATDEPDYNSILVQNVQYTVTGIVPGANYNIRIRAINTLDKRSNWITISGLAQGDTDPPSVAGNVTATGGLKEVSLTWTRPTDPDYSHSVVYENITNNFSTATQIAVAHGDNYVRTGLGYNVTRYYWIKTVDFSGNISGESSVAYATTVFVDADAFSQSVNDLFAEAGAYGIEPVTTLPATGGFDGQIKYDTANNKLWRWDSATTAWTDDIFSISAGSVDAASFAEGVEPVSVVSSLPSPTGYTGPQLVFLIADYKLYRYDSSVPEFTSQIAGADIDGAIGTGNFPNNLRPIEVVDTLPTTGSFQGRQVFLTTDNKTYRYDGAEFTSAVPASDLSGQVVSTQISDSAITTNKLNAGAITANEISAGAVEAGAIAADAITSNKIASGAITAGAIKAGAVTASAIDADAITSDKISANAIQTGHIAANQITGGLIAASGVITIAAQIDDAVITNAKISNGAITTAKIAEATITGAKIAEATITGAKIGSLEVDTANIANGAVTNQFAAYTSGSVSFGGSYVKIQEVTIDCDGNPVSVIGNFGVYGSSKYQIDIRLDGVSQRTLYAGGTYWLFSSGYTVTQQWDETLATIAVTLTPSVGINKVISVWIKEVGYNTSCYARYRYLETKELKR